MSQGPGKYGGLVAVTVFGVGLLVVGRTGFGAAMLGLAGLVAAVTFVPTMTGKVLSLALGALLCSGIFAYFAASNELTGRASYQPGIRGGYLTVTRQDSPAKFREVTNLRWGLSGLCLLASVAGFILCRKLEAYSDDYV